MNFIKDFIFEVFVIAVLLYCFRFIASKLKVSLDPLKKVIFMVLVIVFFVIFWKETGDPDALINHFRQGVLVGSFVFIITQPNGLREGE